MKQAKRKKLESKGWKTGSVKEFLNLSPEKAAYIDLKLLSKSDQRKYRETDLGS